jgi:uncharacterized membrane protein YhhN
MLYRWTADFLIVFHLAFVAFVVVGGFLAWKWPRLSWMHLPAAAWGALIELFGWICPLTPLENWLREAGGQAGYAGGFVEHYIVPIIYPGDLPRSSQVVMGVTVVVINLLAYGLLWRRRRKVARAR